MTDLTSQIKITQCVCFLYLYQPAKSKRKYIYIKKKNLENKRQIYAEKFLENIEKCTEQYLETRIS